MLVFHRTQNGSPTYPTIPEGTNRKRPRPSLALDPRETEVLKTVIQSHILTGQPVGSRTLSRGPGLDLSPATIRNTMADLEARGFLTHPHTSAGRGPTDIAYRLYVDHLMRRPKMPAQDIQAIDDALSKTRNEIPELLAEASRQLSRFSKHVGVVLAPELRTIVVEHVEFVRLDPHRVVAVLVGRSGVVHNRILEAPVRGARDLARIGRYLPEQFAGKTLLEMRQILLERLAEEAAAYDRLVSQSLEFGRRALSAETATAEVFVEGAANLLDEPEFANLERMRALLRTLDERNRLVDLLSRVVEGRGLQVVIGRENPMADLADCSLVASTYRSGDQVVGTVGIMGPKRMEYARAIALVDHLAQVLARLLSNAGE
jgi:heat-inducible transcriptional repressor